MGKIRIQRYNHDIDIIHTRYKKIHRYYIYHKRELILKIEHGDENVQEKEK